PAVQSPPFEGVQLGLRVRVGRPGPAQLDVLERLADGDRLSVSQRPEGPPAVVGRLPQGSECPRGPVAYDPAGRHLCRDRRLVRGRSVDLDDGVHDLYLSAGSPTAGGLMCNPYVRCCASVARSTCHCCSVMPGPSRPGRAEGPNPMWRRARSAARVQTKVPVQWSSRRIAPASSSAATVT